MSKKNLDKLFQEKFSSIQESPDPKVWRAIEALLNQKDKKNRVTPLWWKIGGAAAVFTIGLLVINPFETDEILTPSSVSDTEKTEKTLDTEIAFPEKKTNQATTKQSIKVAEVNPKPSSSNKDVIINTATFNQNSTSANTREIKNKLASTTSFEQNLIQEKSSQESETNSNYIKNNSEHAIANIEQEQEPITIDNQNTTSRNDISIEDKSNNTIVAITEENKETLNQEDKKSIYDEIEAQKAAAEDAIVKSSKWSAGVNVAPVYFNAIGEGSPVGEIFISNSKSGDTNLSYGLSIAYEVSKKLSIRSGIHKADYAYNTNEVGFSSSFNGQTVNQLSTINYDANSIYLEVQSTNAEAIQDTSAKQDVASDASAKNPSIQGVMSQQFDYLEVPLELKYQLVDSKFGVDLIGGVSSLFLIENTVLLSSGSITTTLGEANNINNINFSTNIGIGLNYTFSPKIKINVEPMFKYQLNTFSNTQGTFEPYSIGVYSGLTFKF